MKLFLTGIEGCGKDEIGRKAAELLKLAFFNLNDEIEKKLDMSKKDIIEMYGEENYKNRETIIIKEAADTDGIIASVSADAMKRRSNVDSIHQNGTLIFVDRPQEFLETDENTDLDETRARLLSICDCRLPVTDTDEAVKLVIQAVAMMLEGNVPAKYKMNFRAMMKLIHGMDKNRYAGELLYLNEMAEENDTYPENEEINEVFAEMNGKSAVFVNNMQNTHDSDAAVELTVIGESDRCLMQVIDDIKKEHDTMKYCIHADRQEALAGLRAANRNAVFSTEIEYVLDKKLIKGNTGLQELSLVVRFGQEEFDMALECADETTARYAGEYCRDLPETVKGYGIIIEGAIGCACVLETQSNGFENITEPIWIYTDKRFENKGIATLVLQSALADCIKDAEHSGEELTVLYRCDEDNIGSKRIANKSGFVENRRIYTLEFET